MRRTFSILAGLLALLPGMANAAEPPCLTAGEFTGLASYALPGIIGGTTQRCAPILPVDAFLPRNGRQLSARYGDRKDGAWPQAKAAFVKLSSSGDKQAGALLGSLPDDKLRPLVDTMIEAAVAQRVPPARCPSIDRLVRLVSPLPPENTAELIGLAVGLSANAGPAKVGKIALCPAS